MTQSEWLGKVKENIDVLREFVTGYHPAYKSENKPTLPITAVNAEKACAVIRKQLADWQVSSLGDALANNDIGAIRSLLDGAWIGVPESTDCWKIPGFEIAVDLLDDPPEED